MVPISCREMESHCEPGLPDPSWLVSHRIRHKNKLAPGHRPARTAGSSRREGVWQWGCRRGFPSCLCRTLRPPKMAFQWDFESPGKDSRALGTSSCLLAAAHPPSSLPASLTKNRWFHCGGSGVPRGHSCILLCGTVGKTTILLSYASSL